MQASTLINLFLKRKCMINLFSWKQSRANNALTLDIIIAKDRRVRSAFAHRSPVLASIFRSSRALSAYIWNWCAVRNFKLRAPSLRSFLALRQLFLKKHFFGHIWKRRNSVSCFQASMACVSVERIISVLTFPWSAESVPNILSFRDCQGICVPFHRV